MSPRFVPVSVTELSRVPLLAAIPGADLVAIAERLERTEVAPGGVVVRAGAAGARFAIVLSGLASFSRPDGSRSLLRPGETFDAAGNADATVTAMTLCVVARCDGATFEELIRPHLGG